MPTPLELLVDSPYPGDFRLIASTSNPLLRLEAVTYIQKPSGLITDIRQRYLYPTGLLDGSQRLDGYTLLSGFNQPI